MENDKEVKELDDDKEVVVEKSKEKPVDNGNINEKEENKTEEVKNTTTLNKESNQPIQSKTNTSKKSDEKSNISANSNPEVYVSKNLGISMEAPSNWKNSYSICEENDCIVVSFKSNGVKPSNKMEGFLLTIIKNPKKNNGNMLGVIGNKYITINGVPFLVGGPTGITLNEDHPGYNKYLKMLKETGKVASTIKGINYLDFIQIQNLYLYEI
ncbi:hypothetical protein [Clostridium frigidicarnis]|uniref:Uncharacterized protein n=1 Tax=Clostridium frigidicarnis TaxID=84698 RepID=A0A1I1AKS5_9CLOT|nr:hypothetical protein [Clostridium frigidicarnis]SFB37966.1 hypothetical protein SAMN04488528_103818 [Clostridium frigidicarnis]